MEKNNELKTVDKKEIATMKKDYNKLVGLITKEYAKVESSSLNIAFALHEIHKCKYYEIDGFKNIYEFGEDRFNLARGTVNGFINVIEKFSFVDEEGNKRLKEEFAGFTFSKLCMLVSVPTEYLSEFYSTMTAKEIRDKKSEIAKRIESKEEDTIPFAEGEDISEALNEQDEADDNFKRCYLNIISFSSFAEMVEAFRNDDFVNSYMKNFKAVAKEIPSGITPSISIGFSYINQ